MLPYLCTAVPGMRYVFGVRNNIIDIRWIAHSLAQLNRYVGHAARPISVAEHSLLACEIAERDLGMRDPAALLAVLLHDAHESLVGDISTPLKQHMRSLHSTVASQIERVYSVFDMAETSAANEVRDAFHLRTAFTAYREQIHAADMMALATERRDLMWSDDGPGWSACDGFAAAAWVDLVDRNGMTWKDWRQAFVDRFDELTAARYARMPGATA